MARESEMIRNGSGLIKQTQAENCLILVNFAGGCEISLFKCLLSNNIQKIIFRSEALLKARYVIIENESSDRRPFSSRGTSE